MHKKSKHESKVPKCRRFSEGSCDADEKSCWFLHEKKQKSQEKDETQNDCEVDEPENMEIGDEKYEEQVFYKAQPNIPPDQVNKILMMINKLSLQVEKLEKCSIGNKQ